MLSTKNGGRIKKNKVGIRSIITLRVTEFCGRSLGDKSSRFIDQIPRRSVDTNLKAWQAEENTDRRGRRRGETLGRKEKTAGEQGKKKRLNRKGKKEILMNESVEKDKRRRVREGRQNETERGTRTNEI